MTNLYFTSDWHIGHANSINFDKRPFDSLEHMHEVLINNYNASVKDKDVCYFLGDVGLTSSNTVKEVISKLNGTKVLLLGNHDNKMFSMYNLGFNVVLNSGIFYIGKHRISMSHCPLKGIPRENTVGMRGALDGENWHGESRHDMFCSLDSAIDFHLHGHIHSSKDNGKDKFTDKQFDVGVVNNKYRPVSLSEIISWIDLTRKKK